MIQQIHKSQGHDDRVKESQVEINAIKKSYPMAQNQNIKESLVNVNLDFDFNIEIQDSGNIKESLINIEL